jgi:hypothetical protein
MVLVNVLAGLDESFICTVPAIGAPAAATPETVLAPPPPPPPPPHAARSAVTKMHNNPNTTLIPFLSLMFSVSRFYDNACQVGVGHIEYLVVTAWGGRKTPSDILFKTN